MGIGDDNNLGHPATSHLGQELLESDYRYFESGAELEAIDGGVIVRINGLESLVAGCIVQQISQPTTLTEAERLIENIEQALIERGCPHVRFYLAKPPSALQSVLKKRAYQSRYENGLIRFGGDKPNSNAGSSQLDVTLYPITSEEDWQQKCNLHQDCQRYPDGYEAPADLWVEMERKKSEAGYMISYLIMHDDKVCGTVSAATGNHLLRVKNLVIHPDIRRKGIGKQAINSLVNLSNQLQKKATGLFAVQGSIGELLYLDCGFKPIVQQCEWFKSLKI